MSFARLSIALALSLAACSPPVTSGSDASDVQSSADTSDALQPIDVTTPVDADPCPTSERAATANGSDCTPEGQVCRYGYTTPACGGRTLTCTGGYWVEEHTDPQPSCFTDAGAE